MTTERIPADRLAGLLAEDNLWRHDAGCALVWGKPFDAGTCALCEAIAGVRVEDDVAPGGHADWCRLPRDHHGECENEGLRAALKAAADGLDEYAEWVGGPGAWTMQEHAKSIRAALAASPAPMLDRERRDKYEPDDQP